MNWKFWTRTNSKPAEGQTMFVERRYDRALLGLTLTLMSLGVVMVYSASIASAGASFGDGAHYLKRQLMFLGLALGAMVVTMNLHHDLLRRLAKPLMGVALVLLVLVLIPGVSATAKGASRWINLGPLRFQPAELVKLCWIVFLADLLSRRQAELHAFKRAWGMPLLAMALLGGLLMMQPDFGSTVICAGLMLLMVWAAGARWLHTLGFIGAGLAMVPLAIIAEPYRMKRLTAFLSPEDDPLGVSFHINQALISFGSGEWFGQGLGNSTQKLLYLPEAHTDFIFSIVGEELGLFGGLTVMALFGLFVWRGFHIARKATTGFGALLAFGITAEIGFQALTNMAVATAMMPTKGLTLPFVSYGGSSLLILGASVGVLLNISRQEPPPAWMHRLIAEKPKPRKVKSRNRRLAAKGAA